MSYSLPGSAYGFTHSRLAASSYVGYRRVIHTVDMPEPYDQLLKSRQCVDTLHDTVKTLLTLRRRVVVAYFQSGNIADRAPAPQA